MRDVAGGLSSGKHMTSIEDHATNMQLSHSIINVGSVDRTLWFKHDHLAQFFVQAHLRDIETGQRFIFHMSDQMLDSVNLLSTQRRLGIWTLTGKSGSRSLAGRWRG